MKDKAYTRCVSFVEKWRTYAIQRKESFGVLMYTLFVQSLHEERSSRSLEGLDGQWVIWHLPYDGNDFSTLSPDYRREVIEILMKQEAKRIHLLAMEHFPETRFGSMGKAKVLLPLESVREKLKATGIEIVDGATLDAAVKLFT